MRRRQGRISAALSRLSRASMRMTAASAMRRLESSELSIFDQAVRRTGRKRIAA